MGERDRGKSGGASTGAEVTSVYDPDNYTEADTSIDGHLEGIDGALDDIGGELAGIDSELGNINTALAGKAATSAVSQYVHRGDPAALDVELAALTADGAWRDLNLSAIVGEQRVLVHLYTRVRTTSGLGVIQFRANGASNAVNRAMTSSHVVNVNAYHDVFVLTDDSGVIEYNLTAGTYSNVDIAVRGWFTNPNIPA
jgi:hypothetical protein